MLSLNAVGRGLVLPQLNVPDLLTHHGNSYPLREEKGGGVGRMLGGCRRITVVAI